MMSENEGFGVSERENSKIFRVSAPYPTGGLTAPPRPPAVGSRFAKRLAGARLARYARFQLLAGARLARCARLKTETQSS